MDYGPSNLGILTRSIAQLPEYFAQNLSTSTSSPANLSIPCRALGRARVPELTEVT